MKIRVFTIFALVICAGALDIGAENEDKNVDTTKDKRQSPEDTLSSLMMYRAAKQEQIAPVVEPQEEDKALGNGTTPQPVDPGAKLDRLVRAQVLMSEISTASAVTLEQTSNGIESSTFGTANTRPFESTTEIPRQPNVQQVDIEHRALRLEDRRNSAIPPPKDGKSYTPEEFTSLIVAGYAVTPIPDLSSNAPSNSIFSPYGVQSPEVTPLLPPVGSPSPFTLKDEYAKLNQARLELGLHHYKQRLSIQQSLPPPKDSKGYTPDEFNALVAAGFAVTPIPVNQQENSVTESSRNDEEYRPGQVFSLNPQELLDLQPERKAPLPSNQYLQQLYSNPQPEHKQNLQQQFYFLEPQSQSGRQAAPSHAIITRPQFNFNGGEASVGAALSVSDSGSNAASDTFSQEILALLGGAVRPQEQRQQSSTVQSVAPQYQQIDRYISKPSKKPTKLRAKVRPESAQPTNAPQQYLIETTNVQQQPQQQQYRPAPTQQPQRLAQSLRYVPIQQSQLDAFTYERPESQGLKIVPAPKLAQQQPRAQFNYRLAPQASQYQQQEIQSTPKQYRLVELPRAQPIRQELRVPASSIERPVAYLKRVNDVEKQRSVKIYDPINPESQQVPQLYGEQFVLRPIYRAERPRYEIVTPKQESAPTKSPHSAIYVSQKLPVRAQKVRPQPQPLRELNEQPNIDIVQHGQSLEEQRAQLPPPKNNKAYTPEEFAALVAAGYSVTPVPVSSLNLDVAQSRTTVEAVTPQPKRQLIQRRRNQYLPVRDDAP